MNFDKILFRRHLRSDLEAGNVNFILLSIFQNQVIPTFIHPDHIRRSRNDEKNLPRLSREVILTLNENGLPTPVQRASE